MLLSAGIIGGGGSGGGFTQMTLGVSTNLTVGPASAAQTLTGHTSSTGSVLVRFVGRTTTTTLNRIDLFWGGTKLNEVIKVIAPRSGGAVAWIGYLTGGLTGAQNITTSSSNSIGDICLRVTDITSWSGNIGAVAGTYGTTLTDTISVPIVPEVTGSLITVIGGGVHGSLGPFSVSGYSKSVEIASGSAADTDVACMVGIKTTSVVAGSSVTLGLTGSLQTDDWALAAAEFA